MAPNTKLEYMARSAPARETGRKGPSSPNSGRESKGPTITTPRCVHNYNGLRKEAPPQSSHSSACAYAFVAGFHFVGATPGTVGFLHPKGIGSEGFFQWRPESLQHDNGGTVIKPNALNKSDKGRWHRVFDGAISVKWFGAIGDGASHPLCELQGEDFLAAQTDYPFASSPNDEIDWAAIQAAINAAAASKSPSVFIPPGRYQLTRPIRPEVDNLTLFGSGGAVLVADPPPPELGQEYFPEAILVNKQNPGNSNAPLAPVHCLTISDLTVEAKGGSDLDTFSAGVIQLNNCKDCTLRNVRVKYIGPTHKPKEIDGIVTSQGTTGLIHGCTVEGMSKAGIYVAGGTHDLQVDACEVRHTVGQIGQVGICVTGADRITISNCLSHHNGGAGLLIGVNGPIGENPPEPASNVQVSGGFYQDNKAEGILIASAYDNVRPENIQLLGVATLNNDGRGISIEAGWDVVIANPSVVDSGFQGIWLDNVPIGPSMPRTARVQICNPQVYNNGRRVPVDVPGIGLRAVERVTVAGGKLSKVPSTANRRQNFGIGTHKNSAGGTCTELKILDVDTSIGQTKPVAALDYDSGIEDASNAAQSGFIEFRAMEPQKTLCQRRQVRSMWMSTRGSPIGSLPAQSPGQPAGTRCFLHHSSLAERFSTPPAPRPGDCSASC